MGYAIVFLFNLENIFDQWGYFQLFALRCCTLSIMLLLEQHYQLTNLLGAKFHIQMIELLMPLLNSLDIPND